MQSGNTHQMVDAGARKHLPLFRRDRALVTHRQCGDHTCGWGITEHGLGAAAHTLTQNFNPVTRLMYHRLQTPRATFRPHITGGTDAALEQPGFVIKTMRISQTMRPLQAHRQLPAFAGMNIR